METFVLEMTCMTLALVSLAQEFLDSGNFGLLELGMIVSSAGYTRGQT